MFLGFSSLQVLKVHKNKIEDIEANTFNGHKNLLELDIAENRIKVLRQDMFKGMPSLSKLHVHRNLIQTLGLEVFVNFRRTLWLAVSDSSVAVSQDNPLQCDCRYVFIGLSF